MIAAKNMLYLFLKIPFFKMNQAISDNFMENTGVGGGANYIVISGC